MRLGIHLTLGLLFSVLALVLFGVLAQGVIEQGGATRYDRAVTQSVEAHGQEQPEFRKAFRIITEFGGPLVVSVGAIVVVFILVTKRHHLLALVWLIAVTGGAVLNEVLKMMFQRQRPAFETPYLPVHMSYSFPSGHAMNSVVFYGLLAYLLALLLPRVWQRWAVGVLLGLLVLAIGFSRIYLGVHWLTDVLAGYAAGSIWLAFCITAIETVRRRKVAQHLQT